MNELDKKYNSDDYYVIPNPIYDVVFKYLMEDMESAKIILSILINEKIKKLDFQPISHAEKVTEPDSNKEIRLFHLDFIATIELPYGQEELIMIELQKASQPGDIVRFKRYISANFQKKRYRDVVNPMTQAVETIPQPIRLLPIFILNFSIENEVNDLLIKVGRTKTGIFKNKNLVTQNQVIDHLSYDMWVVQLPNIHTVKMEDLEGDEYLSNLYALLRLFDQQAQSPTNRHRLFLFKKVFPGVLERVITRLRAADADNPDLENQMHTEDEVLAELIRNANTISFMKQKVEDLELQGQQKDLALSEKDQALSEKEKVLQNQARMIEELKKKLEGKQNT